MVRALYSAWTGMVNEQKRLDVVSNNMANADTTGFKKVGSTSQSFDEELAVRFNDMNREHLRTAVGTLNGGVKIGETYLDYSQGSLKITDGTYDVALEGSGFFTISTTDKNGQTHTRYTRDGAFTVTRDGYLVTKDGDSVLGTDGNPIQIPGAQTAQVSIDEFGNIYANDQYVNQFALVDFEDYDTVILYGENMWETTENTNIIAADVRVHQGYLEASNVNVVDEMVDMIAISRAYETNQKMIKTVDTVLEKASNEIGRV